MQFLNKIISFIGRNLEWAALLVLPFLVFSFQYDLANPFVSSKELALRTASMILVFILGFATLFKDKLKILQLSKRLKLFITIFSANIVLVFILSVNKIPFLFGTFERGFGLIDIFLLIAVVVIFILNYKSSKLASYSLAIVFTSLILGIYGILQTLGFDPFFSHVRVDIFEGRAFSFLGNPSYLGQFLAMSIPFVFLLKLRKELKFAIILVLVYSVFASQTRSAVLALIAVSCLQLLVHFVKSFSKKTLLIILAVFVSVFILSFSARFKPTEVNLRSLESRFVLWNYTYDLILEKPVGYGLNNFYIYFPTKVDKEFFKLEESLNTYADRVHNEFLSLSFSYGVLAGLLYLVLVGFLVVRLFKTDNLEIKILISVLLICIVQNQFGFHDLSTLMLFALTLAILFFETEDLKIATINLKVFHYSVIIILLPVIILLSKVEIFNYKNFHNLILYYSTASKSSYESTVNLLKSAINQYPIYSKYWYALMSIDPSSGPRALTNLEKIEPGSVNLVAWKGNIYATSDPKYAASFFEKSITMSPFNPHFVRAYGDFLYKQKTNLELNLALYKKYLLLVPDYYTWKDKLDTLTPEQQKSYRIFFKNVPDFWTIFDRINVLEQNLESNPSLKSSS